MILNAVCSRYERHYEDYLAICRGISCLIATSSQLAGLRNELSNSMQSQLKQLQIDCVKYREAVDQIFVPSRRKRGLWRERFIEIHICASKLYVDRLLFVKNMPTLNKQVSRKKANEFLRSNVQREMDLRAKLKRKLESPSIWARFKPDNAFSALSDLHTLEDYTNRFVLHLPEIYEETFRVESCAKDFLTSHSNSPLTQLAVGLDHLGANHVGFVLQALEGLTAESSWDEWPL